MPRIVLALAAWLCLICAGAAQTPAPTLPALSFPALTGRVVDTAGLLTPQDEAALNGALAGLEARTNDQLVVVTLPSLQGRAIEDYGYQLGRHWGIGQKDRDSGALLIVDSGDKQVRIEVGYGREGTLTDAATKVIIESSIVPAFTTGNYAGGIQAGTSQIIRLLEAGAPPVPAAGAHAPRQPIWPVIGLGLFAVIVLIFCAIHGGFVCQAVTQILFMTLLSGAAMRPAMGQGFPAAAGRSAAAAVREAGEANGMIGEADKARVASAIQAAEAQSAGEIFCVIARRSSAYPLVPVAWAAALALCLPWPLLYFTAWPGSSIYALQIMVFFAAASLLSVPAIRFRIVPRRVRHQRAHDEAMRQFFAQGIDKTTQRTGVLIFASAAERYVEVVADAGINDRVAPAVWDQAVEALVAGIKDGRPADGFVDAIAQCGLVLAAHFPPGSLARRELPDRLLEV